MDAVAYVRVAGLRLAANVENVFNVRYDPTANGDNNISPGAPRSVRISMSKTF